MFVIFQVKFETSQGIFHCNNLINALFLEIKHRGKKLLHEPVVTVELLDFDLNWKERQTQMYSVRNLIQIRPQATFLLASLGPFSFSSHKGFSFNILRTTYLYKPNSIHAKYFSICHTQSNGKCYIQTQSHKRSVFKTNKKATRQENVKISIYTRSFSTAVEWEHTKYSRVMEDVVWFFHTRCFTFIERTKFVVNYKINLFNFKLCREQAKQAKQNIHLNPQMSRANTWTGLKELREIN